uniref:Uncharacterized protein n=1 Tax=Rhizophora mucronata TaxID=61149 RepID=A0A2P2QZ05_RHIMU
MITQHSRFTCACVPVVHVWVEKMMTFNPILDLGSACLNTYRNLHCRH